MDHISGEDEDDCKTQTTKAIEFTKQGGLVHG